MVEDMRQNKKNKLHVHKDIIEISSSYYKL